MRLNVHTLYIPNVATNCTHGNVRLAGGLERTEGIWGVICVKFNMHNISNMPIAFIELTMLTCMHNMSMFMHNMPVFMHNMPVFMHNMPMFMHNMSMFMHNMPMFMHNVNVHAQHANVHA